MRQLNDMSFSRHIIIVIGAVSYGSAFHLWQPSRLRVSASLNCGASLSILERAGPDASRPNTLLTCAETIDAERIRLSIARLTPNSTDELVSLMAELERLESLLDGIGKRLGSLAQGIRAQMIPAKWTR